MKTAPGSQYKKDFSLFPVVTTEIFNTINS